jgi:hypothetical protein
VVASATSPTSLFFSEDLDEQRAARGILDGFDLLAMRMNPREAEAFGWVLESPDYLDPSYTLPGPPRRKAEGVREPYKHPGRVPFLAGREYAAEVSRQRPGEGLLFRGDPWPARVFVDTTPEIPPPRSASSWSRAARPTALGLDPRGRDRRRPWRHVPFWWDGSGTAPIV